MATESLSHSVFFLGDKDFESEIIDGISNFTL